MSTEITLWQGAQPLSIPPQTRSVEEIVAYAHSRQLSKKDRLQIEHAFDHSLYGMVSNFIWNKALSSLKAQLSRLGTGFIAEMLDRPDIEKTESIEQVLTDYEALRLARELGGISSTGYMRLRQSLERIVHFGQLSPDEGDELEMTADEAIGVIRACVENILGQERIDAALDFKQFRDDLESKLFNADDKNIQDLIASPYFFHRASIRILLVLIKANRGAQLEKSLWNGNVIIPALWPSLYSQERFQIGRAYSELVGDGKPAAAAGLKKVLLKVRGFDYVPEDLRSRSFLNAAQKVIEAHEGGNNFYNEPGPVRALEQMGTTIPPAAFPKCMTAVLCVKLGNFYNISFEAQRPADLILKRISPERWQVYLDDCLPADDRILNKLLEDNPFSRWVEIVQRFELKALAQHLKSREIRHLIQESADGRRSARAKSIVNGFLRDLGL